MRVVSYVASLLLIIAGGSGCTRSTELPSFQTVAPTSAPYQGPPLTFQLRDVAAATGLDFRHQSGSRRPLTIVETMGSGCAFVDYDRDGWQDILLVSAGPDYKNPNQPSGTRLYHNEQGHFVDVTTKAGVDVAGYAMGCCIGDYDGDGYPDLFISGFGRNFLLRNRTDGTFEDRSAAAGILPRKDAWGTGCAFVDINRDGKLDLYVANYVVFDPNVPLCPSGSTMSGCVPSRYATQRNELYLNRGGGKFQELAVALGADDPQGAGLGVTVCDFDNDGWSDIFVANDGTPNALLHNEHGRFRNIGDQSGVAYAEGGVMRAGMGCDAADYNGDGLFDLVITNFQHEPNSLYRNQGLVGGKLMFQETTYPSGFGAPSMMRLGFGISFLDVDGDGLQDVFVGNGHVYDNVHEFDDTATFDQEDLLFLNRGGAQMLNIPATTGALPSQPSVARAVAVGDYNNDGAPDLLINSVDRPARLYENRPNKPVHWVGLALEGTGGNGTAIGARVELKGPDGKQLREVRSGGSYLGQADLRSLFRIGELTDPAKLQLKVRWPSGAWQSLPVPALDQYVSVKEGSQANGSGSIRP